MKYKINFEKIDGKIYKAWKIKKKKTNKETNYHLQINKRSHWV